ncbi:hypothetical protein P9112_013537 [Eukaryota sp. TZLM1-RC]
MITSSLPLALPDSDSNILISTDASEKAITGIIWKELEPSPPGTCLSKSKVMPISFYSRILSASQQRWSTIQKELFAIVMTLNQPNLSSFLLSRHLTIFCDHKNLSYLFSCPESNRVVLRWIPVLQSFSFECVHIEGPKNYWADYLSRASLLPGKKKEKKTRDICDNPAPELCCMMTHRGSANSPLWNYLNVDDLTHSSPLLHFVTAHLNSHKHFIRYNLNPEPHELLSPSSARFFVLSTDLPLMFVNTTAPRDFGKAAFDPLPMSTPAEPDVEPLGLYTRNFKVNDLVQQANWNSRIYFQHPKMPRLHYLPEVMPLNAHPSILNYLYSNVTLGTLIDHAHIFHFIPLPTHMAPLSWERNRHLSHRYHCSTPPPCSPRECPNSPKCDHFPWNPDMHTDSPFGEQLYDFCLLPAALTCSDLRPSPRPPALANHQLLPGPFYADCTLPTSRDIISFIPLCLLKPEIHLVYHYDEDEITPCPIAIPCLEMVHGHQIDAHDRKIHYHYLPLDHHSVFESKDEPQFIHEASYICSHFEDIRSLLFDGPTQYHSRLDFVLRDEAFFNVNRSPDDPPAYYLPSSRFHLPTRREIFELHAQVFDHPRFLRSQFMSEDDEHDRRFSSDSAMIDISSDTDSDGNVQIVSTITAATPDDSSTSSDHLPPAPRSFPAQAVLDKLFRLSRNSPTTIPFSPLVKLTLSQA